MPSNTWVIRRSTEEDIMTIIDLDPVVVPPSVLERRNREGEKLFQILKYKGADYVLKYIHRERTILDHLFSPPTMRTLIQHFAQLRNHTLKVFITDLHQTIEEELNLIVGRKMDLEELDQQPEARDLREDLLHLIYNNAFDAAQDLVQAWYDEIEVIFGMGIASDLMSYVGLKSQTYEQAEERRRTYLKGVA